MRKLSDQLLVESYYKAKALNLDPAFIRILVNEISERSLYKLIDL